MPDDPTIDFSEQDRSRVTVLDRGSLHRVLGTPQLFAIGYGDVGSSIYYALGVTTLYALGAAPVALALAGLVFFCTVLTYAELASAMPEAGGSCSFARHAFNDLVSFIAGWALLLDYIVTLAISAYTVGPYLGFFFPVLHGAGAVWFAAGLIAVLFLINVIGIRESTWVSLTLCLADLLTQSLIVCVAAVVLFQIFDPPVFWERLTTVLSHMRIGVEGADWSPSWPDFMKGIGMAMVAYIGIESISQLAGETRHPDQTLPRAMLTTMATLLVFYFAISFVALSAIHPRVLSTTYLEDPIAGIVASLPVGGEFLRPLVALLGASILFVAANAGLIGASRLTFAMGEFFELPRVLYRIHPRFKTPYVSLIVFSALGMLIVLVARNLTHIAELYNFGAMLSFALAHLSLLGMRVRHPELKRPFKAKGNLRFGRVEIPLTAVLGLVGTAAVWVDVLITKPAGRNLGLVWIGVGLVSYFWYRRQQKLSPTARLAIEKLQIPGYQPVTISKILVPTSRTAHIDTVQFAARLAKDYDAQVTALHVIEMPPSLPLDTFFPEKLAVADFIVAQAQAVGREFEVVITSQVKQARFAGEVIVEEAKAGRYDLILLAARARPLTAGRPTFGTTVEYVLRNAPCRVSVLTDKDS